MRKIKKPLIYIVSLISLLSLSGCFNAIPEMSEEEETKIVRYMADEVLAHDTNYQARLLSEQEKQEAMIEEAKKKEELKKIEEEEKKKKEEKEKDNTPDKVDTNVVTKAYGVNDMASYLDLDGIEFEYKGDEVDMKYPDDDSDLGFAYAAPKGYKLLILKFNICNVSSSDVNVDLTVKKAKYRVLINSEEKISSSVVPLDNVMNFFATTISPSGMKEAVLLYEVPEDMSIDSIDLNLSALDKETIKIQLK